MKQVPLRLSDEINEKIEAYMEQNHIPTKQETYRRLIIQGLESEPKKLDSLIEKIGKMSIENKYFIQKIYRLMFNEKHSKYSSPDDEITALDDRAEEIISLFLGKEKGAENG